MWQHSGRLDTGRSPNKGFLYWIKMPRLIKRKFFCFYFNLSLSFLLAIRKWCLKPWPSFSVQEETESHMVKVTEHKDRRRGLVRWWWSWAAELPLDCHPWTSCYLKKQPRFFKPLFEMILSQIQSEVVKDVWENYQHSTFPIGKLASWVVVCYR